MGLTVLITPACDDLERATGSGREESLGQVSLHDVQAMIVHLSAHPNTASAWVEVWGQMLALRCQTWPMRRLAPALIAQWRQWATAQPDSPCIAVCSTAQGDLLCRGCHRTFEEVRTWPTLSLENKRLIWARLKA